MDDKSNWRLQQFIDECFLQSWEAIEQELRTYIWNDNRLEMLSQKNARNLLAELRFVTQHGLGITPSVEFWLSRWIEQEEEN